MKNRASWQSAIAAAEYRETCVITRCPGCTHHFAIVSGHIAGKSA